MGDFLADDSGLRFGGGALYYFTNISRVLLFRVAFVLTRPFGATFGDLLPKSPEKHGLGFGTQGSSLILLGLLVELVVYDSVRQRPAAVQPAEMI